MSTCLDEEYFKDVDAELDDSEHTADVVADSLAAVVDKSFKKKRSDENLKPKSDAIKKIFKKETCEHLCVPKFIWKFGNRSPQPPRNADLKLALTQKSVVKAATAVVHSTQLILKASNHEKIQKLNRETIKQLHMDALILLGHASTDLSLQHTLCSPTCWTACSRSFLEE